MGYEPSFPELTDVLTPENAKFAFKELLTGWTSHKQKRSDIQRVDRFARIAKLQTDDVVGRFLLRLYGIDPENAQEPVLRVRNRAYALYTLPEWQVRRHVDDVLHRPLLVESYRYADDDGFRKVRERYLNELQAAKRVAFDADTFRVLEVTTDAQGYKIVCSRGRYFGFLGTCGVLSDELMDQLIENNAAVEDVRADFIRGDGRAARFKKVVAGLSARAIFAPNLNGLLDLRRRDCKIGLNVMTVVDTDDGPLCMLHRRSKLTAEYPDMHHVIPAGTFQPDTRGKLSDDQLGKAFTLRYKVLSELWEECFEAKDSTSQDHVKYGRIDLAARFVGGDPALRPIDELMKMLSNDEAYLLVTGFGIDMLVASAELSLLLVVKDKHFAKRYEPHWRLNWEFPGFDGAKPLRPECFYALSDVERIQDMMRPGNAIPAGAMAVTLGYRALSAMADERLIDFKVPEWKD